MKTVENIAKEAIKARVIDVEITWGFQLQVTTTTFIYPLFRLN